MILYTGNNFGVEYFKHGRFDNDWEFNFHFRKSEICIRISPTQLAIWRKYYAVFNIDKRTRYGKFEKCPIGNTCSIKEFILGKFSQ